MLDKDEIQKNDVIFLVYKDDIVPYTVKSITTWHQRHLRRYNLESVLSDAPPVTLNEEDAPWANKAFKSPRLALSYLKTKFRDQVDEWTNTADFSRETFVHDLYRAWRSISLHEGLQDSPHIRRTKESIVQELCLEHFGVEIQESILDERYMLPLFASRDAFDYK